MEAHLGWGAVAAAPANAAEHGAGARTEDATQMRMHAGARRTPRHSAGVLGLRL